MGTTRQRLCSDRLSVNLKNIENHTFLDLFCNKISENTVELCSDIRMVSAEVIQPLQAKQSLRLMDAFCKEYLLPSCEIILTRNTKYLSYSRVRTIFFNFNRSGLSNRFIDFYRFNTRLKYSIY